MRKNIWIYFVIFGVFCCVISGYSLYGIFKLNQALKKLTHLTKKTDSSKPEDVMVTCAKTVTIDRHRPWTQVQQKLNNTVVQVFVQIAQFNWLQPYMTPEQGEAYGSGFFINDKGYLVTNAHVVAQAQAVAIQIPGLGRERLDVDVIGVCFDRDMALLRLRPESIEVVKKELGKIPFLKLGDSNLISRGDEVMALGYPLGQEALKSTVGVVSGRENLEGRLYVQIDAAINPGNSGGPSINLSGEVVGINTAGVVGAQNVGYIIPINELHIALKDLFACQKDGQPRLVRRPFLGIWYNASSPSMLNYFKSIKASGVYVTTVYKDSLMALAGVKKGDFLSEVNGHHIDAYGQISVPWFNDKIAIENYAYYLKSGDTLRLVIYRDGKRQELSIIVRECGLPAIRTRFPGFEDIDYEVMGGMVIMELTSNHMPYLVPESPTLILYNKPKNQFEPALVITHILPDSAAQRSRVLKSGMLVKEINGEKVRTLAQFRAALGKSEQTDYIHIRSSEGTVAVFSLVSVLLDEPRLSHIYHYPVSQTLMALMERNHGSKNTTRPVGPFSLATAQPH